MNDHLLSSMVGIDQSYIISLNNPAFYLAVGWLTSQIWESQDLERYASDLFLALRALRAIRNSVFCVELGSWGKEIVGMGYERN